MNGVLTREIEAVEVPAEEAKEDVHHALCNRCYPFGQDIPDNVTAWCGEIVPKSSFPPADDHPDPFAPPENACQKCLTQQACARCGFTG